MSTFEYTGKTALITGASSGIGLTFAEHLAARGVSLVLVARSQSKLEALADRLTKMHGISTVIITQDLGEPDACKKIVTQLDRLALSPDLLINNAGFATYGVFNEISLERQKEEVCINCLVPVELTHALLPAMLKRGSGAVINLASTAGMQPDPYMAIYGATKAFILAFSEALWAENKQRGVHVLALCPGATETAFFEVVNAEEASVGKRMSADEVVSIGLKALEKNRNYVIAGRNNWLLGQLQRFVTRKCLLVIAERMLRPKAHSL